MVQGKRLSREELEEAILKGLTLVIRNAQPLFAGNLVIEPNYLNLGSVRVVTHFFIREDIKGRWFGFIPYTKKTHLCCINPPQLHADGLRMSCWVYGSTRPFLYLGMDLQGLATSLLATLDLKYVGFSE